jgi:NAD(P)H dehydrogenase (quinone)
MMFATERAMNGTEAAEIAAGLGQPVHGVVLTPADLIAQVTAGAIQFPPTI